MKKNIHDKIWDINQQDLLIDNEWWTDKLTQEPISFKELYKGNWDTKSPCEGCSNFKPNRICNCVLGTPVIT